MTNEQFKYGIIMEHMDGKTLIALERIRQQRVEGWTSERDDTYTEAQLVEAATTYLTGNVIFWPTQWDNAWYKPTTRIRDLEKAGALIAAEIDRLKRLEGGN